MLALYLQMPSVRLFFVLVMFVTYFLSLLFQFRYFLSDMSCLDDYNNLVFYRNLFSYLYFLYRRSLPARFALDSPQSHCFPFSGANHHPEIQLQPTRTPEKFALAPLQSH